METLSTANATGVDNEGKTPNDPLRYLTASSIIGDKVHNLANEHMGKIADIMVNLDTGKIEYVIIEFGGFLTIGTKVFAIPLRLLKVDQEKRQFILDQTRETLEKAPGFDMNHWPGTNFHAEESYWTFV